MITRKYNMNRWCACRCFAFVSLCHKWTSQMYTVT